MKIYYNDDYRSCKHSFDTTRKATLIAEKAQESLGDLVQIVSPEDQYGLTEDLVREVHSDEYVNAVLTGNPPHKARSQGFAWDENIYKMAIAHNAGVVGAVKDAMNGVTGVTLSSGLHHAKRTTGSGFCTFNGLAVGATYAHQQGIDKILVIDFDAHAGGGTYSLVGDIITHVDLVVSDFDWYDLNEHDNISDLRYVGTRRQDYLGAVNDMLDRIAGQDFDIAIYNAGMDPFNSGVDADVLAERESIVADWIIGQGIPTAVTMAGGYSSSATSMDEIADLHMFTIDAFSKVPVIA